VSGLLVLAVGLALLAGMGVVAARQARGRSRRQAKVAQRLESLRPSAAHDEHADALFGPDAGPHFLRVRLARADLHLKRRSLLAVAAAILVASLLAAWLGRPIAALVVLAIAAAAAFPLLDFLAGRNVAMLLRELPFLLDGARQHLEVGASLQQAVIRAVEQGGPGVRRHFAAAVRRMQNGATLVESLNWLAMRLEVPEVDILAVAVQTNTRFGGAMSPTLANLSTILRDRARVARELKSATAETRLSGWVLAGLPLVAMLAITVMNPRYVAFLTSTPTGHVMLSLAFGLQAAGAIVMVRLMRLEF
jgi:tight adherence protein B